MYKTGNVFQLSSNQVKIISQQKLRINSEKGHFLNEWLLTSTIERLLLLLPWKKKELPENRGKAK